MSVSAPPPPSVILLVETRYHLHRHDDIPHRFLSEVDAYRAAIYSWLTGWSCTDATIPIAEKKQREEKSLAGIMSVGGFIAEPLYDQYIPNRMYGTLRSQYWKELVQTLPILVAIHDSYQEPFKLDAEIRVALSALDAPKLLALYESLRAKRSYFNHQHVDFSLVRLDRALTFVAS